MKASGRQKSMTLREALIEAHVELGKTPEEAELSLKASDGALPGTSALSHSFVKPGLEREFIEEMKQIFRKMDANPRLRQWVIDEVHKRAKQN